MTGGAFATGNHEAVLGTVLMTAVDGSPAAPAGTSANPLVVTGGGSGGTTTANQGTPGASPWPVTQNDIQATNTLSLTTVGNAVTIPLSTGIATLSFSTAGLTGSGATITAYASYDGTTYNSYAAYTQSGGASSAFVADPVSSLYHFNTAGIRGIRFQVSTAGTGTATITTTASTAPFVGPAPASSNIQTMSLSGGLGSAAATPLFATITPNTGTMVAINATTSATAGASSTLAAAGAITKGFTIQNTSTTTIWWSNSLAAGTALTAANSMQLAAGQSFTSPDWWAPGGALIAASATAAACTIAGSYK